MMAASQNLDSIIRVQKEVQIEEEMEKWYIL